jgi:cell filamentation protein
LHGARLMSESRFYEGTEVLKNKFDIHDKEVFKKLEAEISTARIAALRLNPIQGEFNLEYLAKIHKQIFEPIYSWAGQIRTEDLEKATTVFCPADQLVESSNQLFDSLKEEKFLKGLSPEAFADRAALYFGEINSLHPFYEGNGRTQREFMHSLAKEAGHELDLSLVSSREMLQASFDYTNDDPYALRKMMYKQVLKIDDERAEYVMDYQDRLGEIMNVAPRIMRGRKNVDVSNEYRQLAKASIEKHDQWLGTAADEKITRKLLKLGYPKYKVQNTVQNCSLQSAGNSPAKAGEYAKQLVRKVSRSLFQGIER